VRLRSFRSLGVEAPGIEFPVFGLSLGRPRGHFGKSRPQPLNASLNIFMEASQDFLSASAS